MRLDKLIEEKLNTSKKEMKRLFLRGLVKIDGQVTYSESQNVDSQLHQIEVAGQNLETNEKYYLLAKPSGVVTANKDAQHQTVFDFLAPEDFSPALVAAGRLDRDTQGLLLLTSNGQLVYDLLHPVKKVSKTYLAKVNEVVTPADITAFADGIEFLDGTRCQSAQLKIRTVDFSRKESEVELVIFEGKFHQVKKMFLARGKKVIALKRVTMGPLELGDLPIGSYRALTLAELQQLKPYFR
jgi:16S rRNA pseudouridine516 synthase